MKIIEAKASSQQAHDDLDVPDPPRDVILATIAKKSESPKATEVNDIVE